MSNYKSFSQILPMIESGDIDEKLGMEFQRIIDATLLHQKVGTLSFSIKVKPSGQGRVAIEAGEPNAKPATPARGITSFFIGDDGLVTLKNPRQPDLDGLRSVSDETRTPKAIGE